MAILVLGGAGYIGSHTALELVKAGNEVVIADNLVTGYRKAIPEGAKFYEGDLHDSDFLDNLFHQEKIDAVIHFAAYSLVGESVTNPLKYYDNNLYGTKVLLEAMVKNNVGKIVFSSTAATYGEPENIPILESDRTCPTNPYGETNGVGYSVREVIETARKVTGHPIPATESSRRAGDPARLVASSEKAKSVLGWKPVHDSLEEIIASAWNWHKNHPNGYDEK